MVSFVLRSLSYQRIKSRERDCPAEPRLNLPEKAQQKGLGAGGSQVVARRLGELS